MAEPRRARVTIRCFREDYGLPLPDASAELLPNDPVIGQVLHNAATFPQGLKRILSVESPLIYRVRFARQRAAAWLEDDLGIIWVLAIGVRKDDSPSDDFYTHVEHLHEAQRLLPSKDDYLRDLIEASARLLKALPSEIACVVSQATGKRGTDFEARLGGTIRVRICVEQEDGLDVVWVAVACLDVHTNPVPDGVRDVIFAHFETALAPAEWEDIGSWRGGAQLRYYECCRYAVKEAPASSDQ